MGGRRGYNYSYNFWVEADIIPRYHLYAACGYGYLLEIRTNFKLKRIDNGEMKLGSERLGSPLHEHDLSESVDLDFRLKDYWMSDAEIQSLFSAAFDFARKQKADFARKQKAAAAADSVIPVVVGLDVCTVQQEGEPIDRAVGRAIRPECLMPLYLWYVIMPKGRRSMQFNEYPYLARKSLMMEMDKIRVEDEAGLGLMEVCPVCLRNPKIGDQISFLPCNHACHSLCVFKWLQKKNSSCPDCGVRIPTDLERVDLERVRVDLERVV